MVAVTRVVVAGLSAIALFGSLALGAAPSGTDVSGSVQRTFTLENSVGSAYVNRGDGRMKRELHAGAECERFESDNGTPLGRVCWNRFGESTRPARSRVDARNTPHLSHPRMRAYGANSASELQTTMRFLCPRDRNDAIDAWYSSDPSLLIVGGGSSAVVGLAGAVLVASSPA